MKKTRLYVLVGALFSISAYATESTIELLAGVEAGIETQTAMTEADLNKTQDILSNTKTGAVTSWYNLDTTTHYDLKVGKHYSSDLRPCVSYQLITKHSSSTQEKALDACLNYDGNWISVVGINGF
ncbi:MAG: hypothetical protein P1P93_04790 [Gammaproteobacteria bacterium]|nr:hypothetical protein [Gammaproteobacteria bacterium]